MEEEIDMGFQIWQSDQERGRSRRIGEIFLDMDLQSNDYNHVKDIRHQKTNCDDQNNKRQKIYGTELRHFIVRGTKNKLRDQIMN